MDTLISNFFHDGICRLIPGIVVICLYWTNLVTSVHNALNKGSSVFLAVCILLIAWGIGATLDTMTFAPAFDYPQIRQALFRTNQLAEFNAKKAETLAQNSTNQLRGLVAQTDENDAQKFERVQKVRLQAEIVLFRIMMCISFFTFLRPPNIFSILWPSKTFSDGQRTRWYNRIQRTQWYNKHLRPRFPGIIGTAVFFTCWWFGRKLV